MKYSTLIVFSFAAALLSAQGGPVRPNFVILLTDDQRVDTLGVYAPDCPIPTPHIDRLAKEGIRFDNAFVTTPICAVSRSSILTGRYSTNSGHHRFETLLPEAAFEDSYPMHLKRAGYFVGQLGKYGVGIRPDQKKRFDMFAAQEGQGPPFREYKGQTLHDAEWLSVMTGEFLDAVPEGQPFCVQVNYKEPHSSSAVAPEDDGMLDGWVFDPLPTDTPEQYATLPEFVRKGFGRVVYEQEFAVKGDHNPYLRQHYEKIAGVDRSVGKILALLEARGLAGNTVVIFLSDHGTHFGEKQLAGKWTPYDPSLRIPFIINDPRLSGLDDAVRDEMILNIDLAPTLLTLAGLSVPGSMDGVSLEPLIEGRDIPWRDAFIFEHFTSPSPVRYIPRSVGIRTEAGKFVRWIDPAAGSEEFYDLTADPMETHNQINDLSQQARIDELRRAYDAWRAAHPSTYDYDPYGRRAQALAPEIDWKRFKEARPDVYAKIDKQIRKMDVTWEDAVDDWPTRYAICLAIGYWY